MARRDRRRLSSPSYSAPENKVNPNLEEGTKLVEELLQALAAAAALQDGKDVVMDDADRDTAVESSEAQLEALKRCINAQRAREGKEGRRLRKWVHRKEHFLILARSVQAVVQAVRKIEVG